MSERLLNWGLLSTAKINRAVIPPLKSSRRNRLVAVASRKLETARAYAQQWEIERAFGSYEELLADPEIDVVYNSLPNHLHAEWSIKALRAGKNVLCEKPLALSTAEVDAMAAAAKESAKVLTEAFMYRHHPLTLMAKKIVDDGRLGDVRLIRGAFTFKLTRQGDPRLKKDMGGGSIWDVGCSPISYTRLSMGSEPVECFGWQVTGAGSVDMLFAGQMKFAGDVLAQFDSSFVVPFRTIMEIVGTDAVLTVPTPFKPKPTDALLLSRDDQVERIEVRGGELYTGEVEDMADAVLHGMPPRVSLADSRGNVASIVALIESAETGNVVHLR